MAENFADDILVYYHPDDPRTYIGRIGESGWWTWPAEAGGWEWAKQIRPDTLEGHMNALIELLPENAWLALMLSGCKARRT